MVYIAYAQAFFMAFGMDPNPNPNPNPNPDPDPNSDPKPSPNPNRNSDQVSETLEAEGQVVSNKDGGRASFVDCSVYDAVRNFRLV